MLFAPTNTAREGNSAAGSRHVALHGPSDTRSTAPNKMSLMVSKSSLRCPVLTPPFVYTEQGLRPHVTHTSDSHVRTSPIRCDGHSGSPISLSMHALPNVRRVPVQKDAFQITSLAPCAKQGGSRIQPLRHHNPRWWLPAISVSQFGPRNLSSSGV